ncbi:CDP-alcohol phosphatidyltransferase family protein [Demequina sp.]|uniref:CDP-alcohol phosphatidyltransferase family protein n=1 Tax=Demequina sp. TaxID=2050685 RepID=UPI003D142428
MTPSAPQDAVPIGDAPSGAVWTVPNVISMVRIVLIFVFTWLLIVESDGWAIAALAAAGISDFLDGYLARRWNQVTVLGRLLDPTADRLLTIAVVLGLGIRGIIPWWLVGVLFARDIVVGIALLWARSRHVDSPQVTMTGKWATALLYFFLPLAYLADVAFPTATWLHTVAIIGAVAAAVLYWLAGLGYVRDVRVRAASHPRGAEAPYTGTTEGSTP